MMTDPREALIHYRKANIRRYCRLLETQLTELERNYISRRLSEERTALDALFGIPELNSPPLSPVQMGTPPVQQREMSNGALC
jgi:hypothetical protein